MSFTFDSTWAKLIDRLTIPFACCDLTILTLMKGLTSLIDLISTPWTRKRRSRKIKAFDSRFRAFSTRYLESGKFEDIDNIISLGREVLALSTPGHQHYLNLVEKLIFTFEMRFLQSRKVVDKANKFLFLREAVAIFPPGHPERCSALTDLAKGLETCYQRLGHVEDLEEAILFFREALTLCPAHHPDRFTPLHALAYSLSDRYLHLRQMDDLDDSIVFYREALALRPPGHSGRPDCLNNLAVSHSIRYSRLGGTVDLEEAILLQREAVTLSPPGHSHRVDFLDNLATNLRNRYQQLGTFEDLEEAIVFYRERITLQHPGDPDRPLSFNNLANGLRFRYEHLGKLSDLEEAILFSRKALAFCPLGHSKRPIYLNDLGVFLFIRYIQLGRVVDLEEANSLHREALTLRPPGHPDRSKSLDNLASVLTSRYYQSGLLEDLQEAIVFYREELTLRPHGHPNRPDSLNNLATGLKTRYDHLDNLADLEEANLLLREALTLYPPEHPKRPAPLVNLATNVRVRCMRLEEMRDLEEALLFHRQALTLLPLRNPHRPIFLKALAQSLGLWYLRVSGKMADLEEAILLYREALTLRLPGHPDRSSSLNSLATGLSTRYERLNEMADLQAMFLYYKESTSDSTSYLRDRLAGAIGWAETAMKYQHHSTLDAYTTSLTLLNRSLVSRPDVQAQYGFLSSDQIILTRSLASDAASAAIQAGNLELAVEFLEQGRALLWSEIDVYKYPVEQLRQVQGGEELADCLQTLSAQLEQLVLLSEQQATSAEKDLSRTHSLDIRIKQHRILYEEWEGIVGRIRKIPGFTHFLQTPPFNTLRLAAAEGPVILVNISDYRSDAIILTINNPPILVPLSDIKLRDLRGQVHKVTTNQGIISVLRYLWEYIVSPVVTRLTELGVEQGSRIWWCPTADLCALPLHAAGPYRLHEPNLPDIYISSYISTLSSLIKARSSIQVSESPKLLVVGQPHESLEKVGAEVEIIKQADNVLVDVLLGAEATHEAVLSSLQQHSWAHFACHGHLADDNQLFPSFELFDGRRLTLLELIQARLPNAECAFLAACHSAGGDFRTRDEHIHLSAALQFCGFRSVVGSLWEMFDEDGPMISKEFYKYMFRNPLKVDFKDSASALNFAVREMRKAKLPPERWAMFVHIGA